MFQIVPRQQHHDQIVINGGSCFINKAYAVAVAVKGYAQRRLMLPHSLPQSDKIFR